MKPKSKTRKKKINCSPNPNGEPGYTCYKQASLNLLKRLWNSKHQSNPIIATQPAKIYKELQQKLKDKCKTNEYCWLKQPFSSSQRESLSRDFAPVAPTSWKKNPNEWLSSDDIEKVMKQYESVYPCFKFIGCSPIDFDKRLSDNECVWNDLCNFDIKHYIKKNVFKIGISFNTDPHDKSGEHWVSMFINLKKKEIFYYDSAGDKIPAQIKRFVDRVIEQAKQNNVVLKFDQNYPVSHQYKNTECGIYSIFFLVHMLEDKVTKDYLKTHVIKDEYVETFRNIYFNHV
jgi:hypothetical protein